MNQLKTYSDNAIELLKQLIQTPSYSGEEDKTAKILTDALVSYGFEPKRKMNNVWAFSKNYDPAKPTLLLNSHHDTVKATDSWTYDPFKANLSNGKLIGLGSNDAGGPLVSLLNVFVALQQKNQSYNLVFLASAEEESSGKMVYRLY